MTNLKPSQMPVNTTIETPDTGRWTKNSKRAWYADDVHCLDCEVVFDVEQDALTADEHKEAAGVYKLHDTPSDEFFTDFKTISLPWGVVAQMALMLRDEYGDYDSEGEVIAVSDLINSGIEAHKKAIERNAKYETEGL